MPGIRFTPGPLRGTGTSGGAAYLRDPRLYPDCAPSVPNEGGSRLDLRRHRVMG